jgi:hypothetical protein
MRPGSAPRAGTRVGLQAGFMMVMLLIAIAGVAVTVSTLVTRWADEIRREQEQDLLRIGDEFAGAVASYRRASAGSTIKHPPELEDLLDDRRAFGTVRHLRRLHPDPLTRGAPWGVIRALDGGVAGIYSSSGAVPMAQVALKLQHVDLERASSYANWQFVPREEKN